MKAGGATLPTWPRCKAVVYHRARDGVLIDHKVIQKRDSCNKRGATATLERAEQHIWQCPLFQRKGGQTGADEKNKLSWVKENSA